MSFVEKCRKTGTLIYWWWEYNGNPFFTLAVPADVKHRIIQTPLNSSWFARDFREIMKNRIKSFLFCIKNSNLCVVYRFCIPFWEEPSYEPKITENVYVNSKSHMWIFTGPYSKRAKLWKQPNHPSMVQIARMGKQSMNRQRKYSTFQNGVSFCHRKK